MTVDRRRLIVVVGPSGAGKDSVLQAWRRRLAADAPIDFVRRLVTRPADPEGEDHVAVSQEELRALHDKGALTFHWQAHGLGYGVLHDSLAGLAQGRWAVLNGSRQHLAELGDEAGGCRVVEITASADVRRTRLADRRREGDDDVLARLQRRVQAPLVTLRLVNEGEVDDCAAALERWWMSLPS